MKCVIVYKNPFGVVELNNIIRISNPEGETPIEEQVNISYKSGDSTLTRTVSTLEAVVQIFE